jgi:hypothetical protein
MILRSKKITRSKTYFPVIYLTVINFEFKQITPKWGRRWLETLLPIHRSLIAESIKYSKDLLNTDNYLEEALIELDNNLSLITQRVLEVIDGDINYPIVYEGYHLYSRGQPVSKFVYLLREVLTSSIDIETLDCPDTLEVINGYIKLDEQFKLLDVLGVDNKKVLDDFHNQRSYVTFN